jgi:hypothetical protein
MGAHHGWETATAVAADRGLDLDTRSEDTASHRVMLRRQDTWEVVACKTGEDVTMQNRSLHLFLCKFVRVVSAQILIDGRTSDRGRGR